MVCAGNCCSRLWASHLETIGVDISQSWPPANALTSNGNVRRTRLNLTVASPKAPKATINGVAREVSTFVVNSQINVVSIADYLLDLQNRRTAEGVRQAAGPSERLPILT